MLPTMTPKAAEVMARMTKTSVAPNGKCALLVFMFRGKASEASNDATAIESRDYKYWVIVEGSWDFSNDKVRVGARSEIRGLELGRGFERGAKRRSVASFAPSRIVAFSDRRSAPLDCKFHGDSLRSSLTLYAPHRL